jgi:hypothetical protein
MDEYKYKKVSDWLDEQDNLEDMHVDFKNLLQISDYPMKDFATILKWLEAAFHAGREHE